MTKPFGEKYFKWLIHFVNQDEEIVNHYIPMLRLLHDREFAWIVPNDDNRIEDGRDLRSEFTGASRHVFDDHAVTFLEVLVALSRRVEFNAGGESEHWAWVLIENLGLDKFQGQLRPRQIDKINEILENLIWRNYRPNGGGGFFPLEYTEEDQRKVEIWYQMSAYINAMNVEPT
jgi:hypothetical protein